MNEYFLSLKHKYHISDGLMDEITKAYDAVQPYWMTVNNNTAIIKSIRRISTN